MIFKSLLYSINENFPNNFCLSNYEFLSIYYRFIRSVCKLVLLKFSIESYNNLNIENMKLKLSQFNSMFKTRRIATLQLFQRLKQR